jgi:hypothetical protein
MFPSATLFLTLYELEQSFLRLASGVKEENRFQTGQWAAREVGRQHGFVAAANLVAEKIDRRFK